MEKKSFTIWINIKSYERAKSIAYHTPGLTISQFVEDAIDLYQKQFENNPRVLTEIKRGRRPNQSKIK